MLDNSRSTIEYAFINADEFALTISLVVFVMLTAVLLTLLIFLCASKGFRTLFFRETRSKRKKRPRKNDRANPETVASETYKSSRRSVKGENHPEYFDGVLTVPIGGAQPSVENDRADNSAEKSDVFDGIPTVAIPASRSSSVYTVRNINAASNAKTENGGKKQAQSGKKQPTTTAKQTRQKTAATAKTGAAGKNAKGKK